MMITNTLYHKYIEIKRDYLKLQYTNLKGGAINPLDISHNDETILDDNMYIRFTIKPTIYNIKSDDDIFIKATKGNKTKMKNFLKSQEWNKFLLYLFDSMHAGYSCDPSEKYSLSNIKTDVIDNDKKMVIIIIGTIKKHKKQNEQFKQHNGTYCRDTSSDKKIHKFKVKDFIEFVRDGLYKYTQEGEFHIPNIGQLRMGNNTIMNLEILS